MKPQEVLDSAGSIEVDLSTNPKQKDFLLDQRKYLCYSGGFGSGKTTACNLKGLILSAIIPNNLGVVLRRTYPDLRESTRENFLGLCPGDWIRSWREAENTLTLKNNSKILFRHFENGRIKVGGNWGWFFIDQAEEADMEIFKAAQGRLRRLLPLPGGGRGRKFGMLAMNPNGKDWQYKEFIEKIRPNYAAYTSSSYENKANLEEGYIEDMVESFSQDWVDRFVIGKWTTMSGLIYHEFDEDRHMVDPFILPRDWVRVRGMDWGVDAPATCAHIALAPDGRRFVFTEYGEKEKTPEEHSQEIIRQSKPFSPYRATILDSSAFKREKDLKSVADKYRSAGIHCLPATRDIHASIAHVKWLLKTNRLFFFRGLTESHVQEMQSWKWGARRAGKEIPAQGNDHYIDGMRYALYWLDRKFFYSEKSEKEVAANAASRQKGARLPMPQSMEDTADPVTGLPC